MPLELRQSRPNTRLALLSFRSSECCYVHAAALRVAYQCLAFKFVSRRTQAPLSPLCIHAVLCVCVAGPQLGARNAMSRSSGCLARSRLHFQPAAGPTSFTILFMKCIEIENLSRCEALAPKLCLSENYHKWVL